MSQMCPELTKILPTTDMQHIVQCDCRNAMCGGIAFLCIISCCSMLLGFVSVPELFPLPTFLKEQGRPGTWESSVKWYYNWWLLLGVVALVCFVVALGALNCEEEKNVLYLLSHWEIFLNQIISYSMAFILFQSFEKFGLNGCFRGCFF